MSILDGQGNEVRSDDPEKGVIMLGLDLALRHTGFVVNEDKKVIDHGVISTRPFKKPNAPEEEYFQEMIEHDLKQIIAIDSSINSLVVQHNPSIIVVEVPTFSQSAASGLALGMVRCALMRQVFSKSVRVVLVKPNQCKRITGNKRRTTKEDVKDKVLTSGYLSLAGCVDHVLDSQAAILYFRSTFPEDHPLYFEI